MNNQNDHLLDCLKALTLPSLPKKEWDGESPFTKAVCMIERISGHLSYVIGKYIEETKQVKIIQDFEMGTIKTILRVYPVPDYLDSNVDNMDFEDEDSREAMEELLSQSEEQVMEDVEPEEKLSEWVFPHINNKEEAIAYLRRYKVQSAHLLKDPDAIKAKLFILWEDQKKKNE